MLQFIVMFCVVLVFARIYLNKFHALKGKDGLSIVIALSLTIFLNLIQFIIDLVLKLIF